MLSAGTWSNSLSGDTRTATTFFHHGLSHARGPFRGGIFRALTFAFLRDVILDLILNFRVFYIVPPVVDFIFVDTRDRLRSVLRVFLIFDLWRKKRQLVALVCRAFAAHLIQIGRASGRESV